jgi:hypothetical protein
MTHYFEFVAKISDGRILHMYYKGKTGRNSKVVEKIKTDLRNAYQVHPDMIDELHIKKLR